MPDIDKVLTEESLKEFMSAMYDFNQAFCDAIASEVDFTIKVEVRGNKGEMYHAKVDNSRWRRPKGTKGTKRKLENS